MKLQTDKEAFENYLSNANTKEELKALLTRLRAMPKGELHQLVRAELESEVKVGSTEEFNPVIDRLDKAIKKALEERKSAGKSVKLWKKWAVVAAIFAVAIIGIWSYGYIHQKQLPDLDITAANKIKPGSDKAILTLGNGRQLVLDEIENGVVKNEAGVIISKSSDGRLIYNAEKQGAVSTSNTITAPLGGKWEVMLSDGSKVYLNSGSSLTFPTVFTGSERKVRLSGEGYFEVTHNPDRPFKVLSRKQTVEVLGTTFNINSYADEPVVATSLIAGSVKVLLENDKEYMITPGFRLLDENGRVNIAKADMETVTDWKDGDFYLDNVPLEVAMRKVARWYNLELVYEGNNEFVGQMAGGRISRNTNLGELLKLIQASGQVQFRLKDKKLYVNKI